MHEDKQKKKNSAKIINLKIHENDLFKNIKFQFMFQLSNIFYKQPFFYRK